MIFLKKIDNLLFIYLLFNVITSLYYYDLVNINLLAEDLWNNEGLYTDTTKQFLVGDIILVNFKENFKFNIDLDNTKDKKLVIKLIPDKLLFDYLPDVDDNRSSQKYQRFRNKDQISFQSSIALKIIDVKDNRITLEGNKQFQFNNTSYIIYFRGETNPEYIQNYKISSEYLSNLIIQVQSIETSNQNLQLEQDRIQINDETKRKIFLEYLKKILEEQNFNVP
ncbi:MAG: hypothetical protein KatS3mg129_0717 [Leptospiraceae bacterium]|nr:MAG: hypothetical protein KatS3mg129_0717 [Leptospiraceae bacterium]